MNSSTVKNLKLSDFPHHYQLNSLSDPPREKFIKPQSISTDVLAKKSLNLPEKSTQEAIEECDSMRLNRRYSQMLRNIKKQLADKRKTALGAGPQRDDLYTLKAPQQKVLLTQKIRDSLYHVNQPPRALDQRTLYDSIVKEDASTPKLIARDRLNQEVESWSVSLQKNVKKRKFLKSLAGRGPEEIRPKGTNTIGPENRPSATNFPRENKLNQDILAGKVETWSLLPSKKKPKNVQEENNANERFCKPNKLQFKVVRETSRREHGKYPLQNEEKFMSVEKSIRNRLEKNPKSGE